MIERVTSNIYMVKIPLPQSPLKATNSYIIKGEDRNLIVDTGYNLPECKAALLQGLRELGVSLDVTDIFITHMHPDHLDLVWSLQSDSSKIYLSKPDLETVKLSDWWEENRHLFSRISGLPEDVLQEIIDRHSPRKFHQGKAPEFTTVEDGDEIKVGDCLLQCVETPGHSKGHMCLYEPEKKILICGDHVLNDITPNIALWQYEWNPLEKYLDSLDKVLGFEVERALPGHRSLIRDFKGRVMELKSHHQERLREILSLLDYHGKDAFRIASEMSWDMTYESWDQFPATQKLFATAEALSHLKYLDDKGFIDKKTLQQRMLFTKRH
ncbi:MBL fold metallo-hydrolase [Candidatus Bathyarchaeota archaeon]|nr:MBL fold metallo-hydrolase [Candidatus Bathyarchaeota archaeon]MBS7628690.1 MBL fold metallo-hydrolase [Candidatus Bathyarchaeota archaeon]